MNESERVAVLERLYQAADDGGLLAENRRNALDYFYGRPRGDELPGRSQVQSLDVADLTEAIHAQVLPSFTGDSICEFEPDGPGDEAQARLESDAVNRVFMESSRGYLVVSDAIKDALLLRGAIIKAWTEETDAGRRVRCQAVDPACFRVSQTHESTELAEVSYCCEEKVYTRGELLEMGFSREDIDRIPLRHASTGTDAAARIRGSSGQADPQAGWATEEVCVFEEYARLDPEETGRRRLYRFLRGAEVLLSQEEVETVPYAAGAAWLEPHSFWGLSVYDKVKQVQDVKTAVLRASIDNLINCNFPRTAVNDRVDMGDYLAPRSGGAVRIEGSGPVQDALSPIPVIDTGGTSQAFLTYMDKVRAERGGAALDLQQSTNQVLKSQAGADNIGTILGNAEMIAGMLARNLAETLIRSTFLLVHRLLRLEYREPLVLRLSEEWVEQNPKDWRPRDRVNIRQGLSPSERNKRSGAYQAIIQAQLQAIQMGLDGILVSHQNFHSALIDWARASDIEAPERYFTDPASPAARQGLMAKAENARQNQGTEQALLQLQAEIERQKLALAAWDAEAKDKFNYWKERLHAEIEEAKLIGAATLDLQRVELEGRVAERSAAAGAREAGGGNGAGQA